jgi:outer membrane receptor for Fe3+-dicitrate
VYYIEWENIQLQIPAPGTGIPTIANGGDAVSRGIELETRMYISENFDVLIGFTSTQAELTTDSELRSGYNAYDGDQLPGVPDRTFTLSMNYSQPAFDGEITYHLDGSYRSETQTALNKSYSNYYELSGFGMWNASATWGNETYKAGLYISNITDELGITSVDLSNDASDLTRPGSLLYLRQPRTIGINLGVSF